MIASPTDAIYYDSSKNIDIDLDQEFKVDLIKQIVYDEEDNVFYILANKYEEKLGFFIIKINEHNPLKDSQFIIKWKNKLDINDSNIFVLRNQKSGIKELIISFKTIYINTYNIMAMDISRPTSGDANTSKEINSLIFRHESF